MRKPAIDTLIDTAITHAAVEEGYDPAILAARGERVVGTEIPNSTRNGISKSPDWSEEEVRFLEDNLGVISMQEIARLLGRSKSAIKIKMTRLGLWAPSKQPGYLTANRVANALGVDNHAVCRWHKCGFLLGFEIVPGAHSAYWKSGGILRIRRSALIKWVIKPDNWPYWLYTIHHKIRAIPDDHIRRLVHLRLERWPDEWWTTGQAAAHHGITTHDVTRYIYRGEIPGIQNGNWYVKKSDVLKLHYIGQNMGHAHSISPSPAADAFIVLAYAAGLRELVLKKLLTGIDPYARLAGMKNLGYLPEVIRDFDLPVQHDPKSDRLFADWWSLRHRFPALWRTAAAFHAGQELSTSQRLDLKAILSKWAHRHGGSRKKQEFARKLNYGSKIGQAGLQARYETMLGWGIDPLHRDEFNGQ